MLVTHACAYAWVEKCRRTRASGFSLKFISPKTWKRSLLAVHRSDGGAIVGGALAIHACNDCTHVGVRPMLRTYAVSLLPTIRNMRLLTLRSFNTGLRGREHILEHGPPIARQPREQVAELAAGLHCPGEDAGSHRLRLTG